jgi:hypothetical protein
MKPDIMAPGHYFLSAGAQFNQTNECDDPDNIPDPGKERAGLASKAGTSMATPVVSASAAKIRQYFREGYHPSGKKNSNHAIPNPSAALIKAVLMNGAQPLVGVDNVAKGGGITRTKLYDIHQGFGRLSFQDSVYLHGKTNVQLKAWDRESVKVGGTPNKYDVTIDKSQGCQAEDLSVTLVWMDPRIDGRCKECLVNDLDLSVSFGGKTHYPNGRDSPDRKNNVERVIINGVQHGETATISVNAHNMIEANQNYALVATACFGGVANKLEGENVFDSQSAAPSTSPAPSTSSSPSASSAPSLAPSPSTSSSPSSQPSSRPSLASSPSTSSSPSSQPSSRPSLAPSPSTSSSPSSQPSSRPSASPGNPSKSSKPSKSPKSYFRSKSSKSPKSPKSPKSKSSKGDQANTSTLFG